MLRLGSKLYMESIINEEMIEWIDKFFTLNGVLPKNPQERDSYFKERIKRAYHHLFDHIDWELKLNDDVNKKINELENFKSVLNFDIRKYFYYIDEYNQVHYDEARKNEAELFVKNWPEERKLIETKIEAIKNKKHFKVIFNSQYMKLLNTLNAGDNKFKRYDEIFALDNEFKTIDLESYKKAASELEEQVFQVINEVTLRHVFDEMRNNPEVVMTKRAFTRNHDYVMQSTAFLSSKDNKNLKKYFNDKYLKNILDTIYQEYLNYKKLEPHGENKIFE